MISWLFSFVYKYRYGTYLDVSYYASGPVANKLTRPRNTWADSLCARKGSPSTFHTPSFPDDLNVKAGVCNTCMKKVIKLRLYRGKKSKPFEEIYFMVFDKFEIQRIPASPSELNKVPAHEIKHKDYSPWCSGSTHTHTEITINKKGEGSPLLKSDARTRQRDEHQLLGHQALFRSGKILQQHRH